MIDETFTLLEEDGTEKQYDKLFSFSCDGVDYIAYMDAEPDDAGNYNTYASIVDPKNPDRLLPIESEEQWKNVEDMMAILLEARKEKQT